MLVFERPEACYCYDDGENRYERETPPHILHACEQVHSEDTGHEGWKHQHDGDCCHGFHDRVCVVVDD